MKNSERQKLKTLRPGESIQVRSGSVAALRNEVSKANAWLDFRIRLMEYAGGVATIGRPAEAVKWSVGEPDIDGEYLAMMDDGTTQWATFARDINWSVPGVVSWANVPKPDMGGVDE